MLSLTPPTSVDCAMRLLWLFRSARIGALLAAMVLGFAPGAAQFAAAQDLSVSYGRTSIAEGDTLPFGQVRQGRVVTRNLVVRNLTSEAITLANPQVSGPGFSAQIGKTFLRPNKTTRLLVRIDGNQLGNRVATVSIPIQGAFGAPFSFVVSGDVVGPRPRMRVSAGRGVLETGDEVFYGMFRTGQTAVREFAIRNNGQQNLILSSVTLTGEGFELVNQPAATVRPGKNTRFRVRMSTEFSGSPQGVATFTTNDPDVPSFVLMLSGAVAADGPVIQVIGLGKFLSNNQDLSFGNVNAGDERSERFTVRNIGNQPLTLGPVVSSDPGFNVTIQPATILAPGRNTEFFVTFISSLGDSAGTISIPSNSPENNPFVLHVDGTGEPAPDIQVLDEFGNIISRRNGSFDLTSNTILPPNAPIVRDFTIRNVGTLTLTLAGVSVQAEFFIQSAPGTNTLLPGEETKFQVGFISFLPGQQSSPLTIFSNDPNDNPFTFEVIAVVSDDTVPNPRPARGASSLQLDVDGDELAPGSVVDFGVADVGERIERQFTITNSGSVDLILGEPRVHGVGFTVGELSSSTVGPGEEVFFTVIMESERAGKVGGAIFFKSNADDGQDPFVFLVTGLISDQ